MVEKISIIDWKIMMTGLIVLGAIEIVALLTGHNGTILTIVLTIIALAIGIAIPNPVNK